MSKRKTEKDSDGGIGKHVVPAANPSNLCFAHKTAIAKEAIRCKLVVEASNKRNVSFPITLCKNTSCEYCYFVFKNGESVTPCGYDDSKLKHTDCHGTALGRDTYRCQCHNRPILKCHSTAVYNHRLGRVLMCANTKCHGCAEVFVYTDKVEFVLGSAYHAICTRDCYKKNCGAQIPATGSEIGCAAHSIKCLICKHACTPLDSRVAVCYKEANPPISWICTQCSKSKKDALDKKNMKITKLFACADGTDCWPSHDEVVHVMIETIGISPVCTKARCIGCNNKIANYTEGHVFHAPEDGIICNNCYTKCNLCGCVLVYNRGGVGPFVPFNHSFVCCSSHAIMPCGYCHGAISNENKSGKYYEDKGKWMHHACHDPK